MELFSLPHLNGRALCIIHHQIFLIMLPDKIIQSDLLDILFENRNKTYGAYVLRRSYNKTMAYAIGLTCFIALTFSVMQFFYHAKQKDFAIPFIIPPDNIFTKIDPVEPKPKNPLSKHAATPVNRKIFSIPVIRDHNNNTQMPASNDLEKNVLGPIDAVSNGDVDVIQPPVTAEQNSGNVAAAEIKPDESVLSTVQVMPEYSGGIEALKKFMLRNLRQPEDLQPGEKIVVIASFIINRKGQIEQVKIINNGRPDLNKEVQRVINKMPAWTPGIQNGNNVAVYFNLPVTFMSEE
jgi:protein TonB